MDYRKYRAKTFQEARLKMMVDVGNKAYIVSQKNVREGGVFGLFGKLMVEITAGILEPSSISKYKTNPPQNEYIQESRMDPDFQRKPQEVNEYYTNSQSVPENPISRNIHTQEHGSIQKDEGNQFRSELDEIKTLISKILVDKDISNNSPKKSLVEEEYYPQQINFHRNTQEKSKELIKMLLKDEDFDENFIEALCALSSVELFLSKEKDLSRIKDYLKQQIAEIILTSNGINLNPSEANVIVVIGPTGVGKTTTLAKLGAYFGVFQKKKVKFISIDTYRVGAIQQLKLYADIMEIPFAKVNNVAELKMEIYDNQYDLVLIDTTGRSQKNLDEIREIKDYINVIQSKVHVALAVSATTKYKDLVEILEKFDILNYTSIIITKLDETNSLGQVISAISPKKKELSYVTFGQSVPEDIEVASKNKILDMVLKA